MTDASELLRLADLCETASGLDRELDAGIRLAVLGDCTYGAITGRKYEVVGWGTLSGYVDAYRPLLTSDDALDDEVVPRYTASLDAAMGLIPGDRRLHSLGETKNMVGGPWLALLTAREQYRENGTSGKGATAPLALCAASLHAIASTQEQVG